MGIVPVVPSSVTVRDMEGQIPLLCVSYWGHRCGGDLAGLIGFLVPLPVLVVVVAQRMGAWSFEEQT